MIPESFLEELRYRCDIEQVISSYVTLKRRGRNLTGLCPFHSEKTPSFTVYPDNQSYYCFGCGKGGDVITFIREAEHLGYVEAIRLLAQRAGLSVPEDADNDHAARQKARILEINRASARFFHNSLTGAGGKAALEYLLGRGLTKKTIRTFGIGWAPDTWASLLGHLREQGFAQNDILEAAVASPGKQPGSAYDMFRGRIMFPIIDLRGNVIGFGGRILGERGPKYLNSPDTPVFKKSRNLYAMNFAKAAGSDTLLLAEGYMDVIALYQAGFHNVVATLGTSLTGEQARLISQYAKQVTIAYDSDNAGQTAAKRALNLFAQTDVSVRVLEIHGAKDPDEYIKKFGAARFSTLIEGGKSALQFETDKLRSQFSMDDSEGKAAFINAFCRLMAGVHQDVLREVYISQIAGELEVSAERLREVVSSLRKREDRKQKKLAAKPLPMYVQLEPTPEKRSRPPLAAENLAGLVAERDLIALLMQNPDYYDTIRSKLCVEDFQNEQNRQIFAAMEKRLLQNQLPEMIYLSAELSPESMARLSKLLADSRGIPFYREQVDSYIAAIKAQAQRKSADEVGSLSGEELQQYIVSLSAGKK